jgi:hypothetical protein
VRFIPILPIRTQVVIVNVVAIVNAKPTMITNVNVVAIVAANS